MSSHSVNTSDEGGRKKIKMASNNEDEISCVSSGLDKVSVGNRDHDLELVAKNLLNMLKSSNSESSDSDFYKRLNTELFLLKEHLPGPITVRKLMGLDVYSYEYLSSLDRFADLYYSQLLQSVLSKVNDVNWFNRSLSDLPCSLVELVAVDGATFTMFYESLVTLCEIIKSAPGKASQLDIAVKLLEFLVKCDGLQSAFLSLDVDGCDSTSNFSTSNNRKNMITLENRKEMWTTMVTMFVSLPDRIANKLSGKFPDMFLRDNFSRLCCHHIAKCVGYSAYVNMCCQEKTLYIECLSKFFSKCLIHFNGSEALKDLIKILYLWCSSKTDLTDSYSKVIQKLFASLDSSSVEVAAIHVLSYSSESADVSLLFGYDIIDISCWYHVLLNKLPLMSFTCDVVLIKNLVCYLGKVQQNYDVFYEGQHAPSGPVKNYVLSDLLWQLITLWSDKSALTHTPVEQHLYLSRIIVLSVNFIASNFNNCGFFNVKPFLNSITLKLSSGLPEHLQSTSEILRVTGMIVTECIFKIINAVKFSDNNNQDCLCPTLEFDYSGMPEDQLVIVNEFSELSCYEFIQTMATELESQNLLQDLLDGIDITSGITSEECMSDKMEKKEVDEKNDSSSAADQAKSDIMYDEDDDILDSDDDLVPYDLSNDVKILEIKRPKYLRDLIKSLVETQDHKDPDVWIASIKACEQLVYEQLPNDDVSLGFELIDLLLSLDMKFYCDNFDMLKYSSALAVIVVYPEEMAEYICKKFHEDNRYSISQRLFILDLLSGGAKILSDPSNDPVKKARASMLSPSVTVSSEKSFESLDSQLDCVDIVKQRINSKTRRFHSPQIPQDVGKKNIFAKVAGSFLFPLLRGKNKTGSGIMFRVNDSTVESPEVSLLLLVHILQTCAVVMACSVNCHAAVKMAKELLEATWSLRFHPEARIREEVISCTAAVILAVPKSILNSDLFDDVIEAKLWLQQIISSQHLVSCNGEVDTKCIRCAAQVVMLIEKFVVSADDSF